MIDIIDGSSYFNGNYFVSLCNNGTKVYRALRKDEPTLKAEFPDSIDLKITNKCNIGCPYCHESSTISGKSFNLEKTIKILDTLPRVGIEIAIGGGDIFEDWNDTKELLNWLKHNRFYSRVTVNFRSIEKLGESAMELWYHTEAVGVSLDNNITESELKKIETSVFNFRTIYHVIVGINSIEQIKSLLDSVYDLSILVLGYKNWGRGRNFTIKQELLENWKNEFKQLLLEKRRSTRNSRKSSISFDNLAIEQLDLRGCILEQDWITSYMGDDFTHSMYIDAVEEVYSPTSRDPFRVSWNDMTLLDFFRTYRKEDILK